MVPTYDFKGTVSETSMLQEHVVGTKSYVLTLGSPKRKHQHSLVNASA